MAFSGLPFLYYFLPVSLAVYFALPKKCKNAALLALSLIFCALGEPLGTAGLALAVFLGWLIALGFEKYENEKVRSLLMAAGLVLCMGPLFLFKYSAFTLKTISAVTGLDIKIPQFVLPVGISFYSFQLLGYLCDVKWGKVKAEHSFWRLLLYISMFWQFTAGPILSFGETAPQLENRQTTLDGFAAGFRRFILGLAKKVLIADNLTSLCTAYTSASVSDRSVLFAWGYALALTLQIYFDFSGYSDMALGLGRMLGFNVPENFNYPLYSVSMTEFWRRWHISLGRWFREYIYIPLGGNRVSRARWYLNILAVWLATGLWHGANFTFILWGLMFALLLVIEKGGLLEILEKHRWLGHIYVVVLILFSFVLFSADSIAAAGRTMLEMMGLGGLPLVSSFGIYKLKNSAVLLILAAVGSMPCLKQAVNKIRAKDGAAAKVIAVLEPLFLAALLILCSAYMADGSFNPFLYFRF